MNENEEDEANADFHTEYRGEDPNAKFLAMVAQREAGSTAGWWRRLFRKGGKGEGESGVGGGNDGGKGDRVVR